MFKAQLKCKLTLDNEAIMAIARQEKKSVSPKMEIWEIIIKCIVILI